MTMERTLEITLGCLLTEGSLAGELTLDDGTGPKFTYYQQENRYFGYSPTDLEVLCHAKAWLIFAKYDRNERTFDPSLDRSKFGDLIPKKNQN